MRIDVVTIFPDYLAPLRLSLVGRAIASGRVELGVHDLRTWTTDRHRTVDDTPYGGGAGMVMLPEPWGQALDAVVPPDADRPPARLVVLTPAGRPFTQAVARELAAEDHLVFACGRYEGIDARVAEEAATRMRVDELSVGDYVLNGGEAAVLVIVEAVVRLLPGVVGNPASLTEESHAPEHDGLLEGPVYTKPTGWRGHGVPPVLLTGDHARIAAWRREQAMARTRVRRPDLLPPDPDALVIEPVRPADVGALWSLQRAAYVQEGHVTGSLQIPPLAESYAEFRAGLADAVVLVGRIDGRLVGSVRGRAVGDVFWVKRLMVAPDRQGEGLGGRLLAAIEAEAPAATRSFRLLTGAVSRANIAFYRQRGYRVTGTRPMPGAHVVVMEKRLPG